MSKYLLHVLPGQQLVQKNKKFQDLYLQLDLPEDLKNQFNPTFNSHFMYVRLKCPSEGGETKERQRGRGKSAVIKH